MRTLEQKTAAHAWEFLNGNIPGLVKDKIATACKKTSSRILTSGLIPTLAFCMTKKGKDSDEVQQYIAAEGLSSFLGRTNIEALRNWLIKEASAMELRQATDEALVYLTWLARLAEGDTKAGKGK